MTVFIQRAKRIVINSIVQYTRLVFNLCIAFISVRLILKSLGTSDYGIYDVVGGVIAFLGFVNSSLSQTSLRFLSVNLQEGETEKLRKIFSNCFWLHLFIAITLFAVLEFVGLFLFNGFLNIPVNRTSAAKVVYHCMVIITTLNIVVVPFSSLIVAHEKFIYTASVSILDSLLKLAIALILMFTTSDKLIIYGRLMTSVTILNAFFYISYILIKYRQEFYIGMPHLSGIRSQSAFAGWTVLDILGSIFNRQGYVIMLNMFFGTTTNASFAISRQVEGQIYSVSASIIDAMKPQIMKSYGVNDRSRMFRLSMSAGKLGFILMSFVCIPLLVYTQELFTLWLANVPAGAVTFTRFLLAACMMEQITKGLVYANQATGNIKWFSVIVSGVRGIALPFSFLLCYIGYNATSALAVYFVCETLASFSRVIVMSKTQGLKIRAYFRDVICKAMPPLLLSIGLCFFLQMVITGMCAMMISTLVSLAVFSITSYIFGLSTEEKSIVQNIKKSFIVRTHEILKNIS